MNRAKPIEAGCLALVISSEDEPAWLWQTVEVLLKGGPDFRYKDYWRIDVPTESCPCYCREDCLMRRDDPDNQKQIESEREKVYVLSGD